MKKMDLLPKVDFHVHSAYSPEDQCEGFTIPVMCKLADKLGIKYVLLTDHWEPSTDVSIFENARRDIEGCRKRYKVNVLLSAEISAINSKGETAIDLRMAKEILDIVSVSPHHYGWQGSGGVCKKILPDILEDARNMVISLAENEYVDFILHPQIIGNLIEKRPIPKEYYQQMMAAVKKSNKVVECTSIRMLRAHMKHLTGGENHEWWSEKVMKDYSGFIQAIVENDVRFAIGTDAHNKRYPNDDAPWFGETQQTISLLTKYGIHKKNLWIPHLKGVRK